MLTTIMEKCSQFQLLERRMVIAVQRYVDQPADIQKAQDIIDNKYSWTLDQPLCVLKELSRNY